ncbi:hypothetical protein Cgig2_012804 [Carnegiea gigantea]|uniref:Uncharacterized protein n=1 Tax=Carnegiea gigantea TaxID=171969 RepID=A0A9Q1QFF1_9CARY|nr:hypothetical protein Cgig2_012804 [Carnegiea gigantea]
MGSLGFHRGKQQLQQIIYTIKCDLEKLEELVIETLSNQGFVNGILEFGAARKFYNPFHQISFEILRPKASPSQQCKNREGELGSSSFFFIDALRTKKNIASPNTTVPTSTPAAKAPTTIPFARPTGIFPEKLFDERSSVVTYGIMADILEGISPERSLEDRSSVCKEEQFAMPKGKLPFNPIPDK